MDHPSIDHAGAAIGVVFALDERPAFAPGEHVRIAMRQPVAHYRVPTYLRGKPAVVEAVMSPIAVDNEEEGYGRNAGSRGHYYRLAFLLRDLWPAYPGRPQDSLRIEVFQSWIERS
jgi:nitrile hydratase